GSQSQDISGWPVPSPAAPDGGCGRTAVLPAAAAPAAGAPATGASAGPASGAGLPGPAPRALATSLVMLSAAATTEPAVAVRPASGHGSAPTASRASWASASFSYTNSTGAPLATAS